MDIKKNHIYLVLLGLLLACVKPYDFDPLSFEKVLVIDGLVTNEPGPYYVKITYTYPLDTVLNETVSNAQVWVEDADGIRYDYSVTEVGGQYQSPAPLVGTVGQTYVLHVVMPDGEEYQSHSQELRSAPEIADIYHKYTSQENAEGTANVGGIQFFVNSDNSDGKAQHFRYEWEDAYRIIVPYPAIYKVLPDSSIVALDTTIGICYKEGFSKELIYTTTIGTTGNKVVEFPVRFVSEDLQHLKSRYTLNVKQYAINESTYLFLKQLKENNESGGSLFDKQTGSIFGNIYTVNDPDKAVLGFFEASGVSTRREFFRPIDFDERLNYAPFPYTCNSSTGTITTPDSALYYINLKGGNIYYYDPYMGELSIQPTTCTDCSFYADVIPPDYWEQ